VARAAIRIPHEDKCAIAELATARLNLPLATNPGASLINNQEVTQAIRSLEVTSQVSESQPSLRQALVQQQQRWGERGGLL